MQVGDRFNDPWMRAMMVSPSAQGFMKTTLYGMPDFRNLGALPAKPAASGADEVLGDPQNGMSTEKFSGSAVAFTPTEFRPAHRFAAVTFTIPVIGRDRPAAVASLQCFGRGRRLAALACSEPVGSRT